jgi:hypothetical protein
MQTVVGTNLIEETLLVTHFNFYKHEPHEVLRSNKSLRCLVARLSLNCVEIENLKFEHIPLHINILTAINSIVLARNTTCFKHDFQKMIFGAQ